MPENKEENVNVDYMIYMMNQLLKEKRETYNKRAKKIADYLIEKIPLTKQQNFEVMSLTMTIQTRLGNTDEAIKIGENLLSLDNIPSNKRNTINQKLEHAKAIEYKKAEADREKLLEEMTKQSETDSENLQDDEEDIKVLRNALYNGEIEVSDLKKLIDEHHSNVKECIFFAEACKHFELDEQGIKCLKSFSRANDTTLSKVEKKAISESLELLHQKKVIKFPKEKWEKIYEGLKGEKDLEL